VINELILQTRRQRPVTSIVVTHDMKTVTRVADRVVMLYPLSRLQPGEDQVLFDGTPAELQQSPDPHVRQFIEGEARNRLQELARQGEWGGAVVNERAIRFRIGLLVLLALGLLGMLVVLFGSLPSLFKPSNLYTVRFVDEQAGRAAKQYDQHS